MANQEQVTGTKDAHYDLISVVYHALQGAETCQRYMQDAEQASDQDAAQYLRDVQTHYRQLAERGKQLLAARLRDA